MKIYDFVGAPNPKKLRVYLAEKGLHIPIEPVDIISGQNRTPEFLRKNPLGGLPVLELDDGTHLTESLAIIEYFEELHPDPPMIGTKPLERAQVRALERIAEIGVMSAVGTIFQNTHPFMAGRIKQSPEAAENARNRLTASLRVLDAELAERPVRRRRPPDDCGLHPVRGARLRRVRPGADRPRVQERRALARRVQETPERRGVGALRGRRGPRGPVSRLRGRLLLSPTESREIPTEPRRPSGGPPLSVLGLRPCARYDATCQVLVRGGPVREHAC